MNEAGQKIMDRWLLDRLCIIIQKKLDNNLGAYEIAKDSIDYMKYLDLRVKGIKSWKDLLEEDIKDVDHDFYNLWTRS